MNNIGKNIRNARQEKGFTQEELAERIYVTRNSVSNYETGRSKPDIEMLRSIAEALDTDPNTLIYGEKKTDVHKKLFIHYFTGIGILLGICLLTFPALKPITDWTNRQYTISGWFFIIQGALYPLLYFLCAYLTVDFITKYTNRQHPKSRILTAIFWSILAVIICCLLLEVICGVWTEITNFQYNRALAAWESAAAGTESSFTFQSSPAYSAFFDTVYNITFYRMFGKAYRWYPLIRRVFPITLGVLTAWCHSRSYPLPGKIRNRFRFRRGN